MSTPDEQLESLKQEAEILGISFSNNIGYNTLLQRVEDKKSEIGITADTAAEPSEEELAAELDTQAKAYKAKAVEVAPVVETTLTLKQKLKRDALKLVRLRITNLDPKKKDLVGEVITVANEYIGTVRKFVQYGEATQIDGYHVPYCIYEFMRDRKFLNIRVRKGSNDKEYMENHYVPEYALEVLPQLTQKELDKLAAKQAAAGGLD